jgi:hypothetical protein
MAITEDCLAALTQTCPRAVHDVDEAEFEIAGLLDYPNPVHLNRFVDLVCL